MSFFVFVLLFGGDVNPVGVGDVNPVGGGFGGGGGGGCVFFGGVGKCTGGGGGSGSVGGRLGNHVTGSLLVFVVRDAGHDVMSFLLSLDSCFGEGFYFVVVAFVCVVQFCCVFCVACLISRRYYLQQQHVLT